MIFFEGDGRVYISKDLRVLKSKKSELQWISCKSTRDMVWKISSNIPHETFLIMEENNSLDIFCEAIIFSIKDITGEIFPTYREICKS